MQPEVLSKCSIDLCCADNTGNNAENIGENSTSCDVSSQLDRIYSAVADFINKTSCAVSDEQHAKHISRIFIPALDQVMSSIAAQSSNKMNNTKSSKISAQIMGKFLLQLKHMIRSTRVCLTVTVQPCAITSQTLATLRQVADTVLSVESFAGRAHSVPYEFKDFQGFLVLHKIQQYGSTAPFRPPGARYGLKRDRRKLHIEPLHLPPEESRAFSTTGGAAAATTPAASSAAGGIGAVAGTSNSGNSAKSSGVDACAEHGVDHHHHHHGHEHDHSNGTSASSTSATASTSSSAASTSAGAVAGTGTVSLTPLQASLAALKAARLSSAAGGGTAASVAPISIQSLARPMQSANLGTNSESTNSSAVPAVAVSKAKTPPLQPGQACGAQSRAGQTDKYDF